MKKRVETKFGYVVVIIVNIILFYIFNHLLLWHIPFLLQSWNAPLGIINIQILGTITATLIYLIFDPSWFKALTKTILNIVSFLFMLTIYYVFPFNFSVYSHLPWLENTVKILIIISLALTTVGILVEFIKIFVKEKKDK
ncbi:TPA: hypothetical protein DD449_04675 [Candidatus Berkelbacteria bacterium]|uniref:Uncharacterized protein n=1 Tax=Berkelbacteria bacterium GW2011_GWE1_39_12 TaxID=1618337 RepID=A0A0G4B3E1_9BACT|nr:MAG: hypothetical protein UT28_C0001G0555 [Berkelbacteria bacterium GW2011_GWE1_39_12]HBO60949.1 hypothetical protein [Candidatus Berkelbacteria bacterium]